MEFKVGCSPITNKIYAGKVKNGTWIGEKHDITNDAVRSVAENLLRSQEKYLFSMNGERYEMKITKQCNQALGNNPKD